jgi:hypothetical protein
MPSGEFKQLLEREFSKAAAKPITDISSPLLQELVNSALMALRRCDVEASEKGKENEDIAAFALFRHIIEMGDGVEVLISNGCGTAAIPLLRSMFEGSLGLSYLLESDELYVQRSLSWFCCHLHDAIQMREVHDPTTAKGKEYLDLYEKDFAPILAGPRDRSANTVAAESADGLRAILTTAQLAPIEAEYNASKRRNPEWFCLFGGPPNRFELAKRLELGAAYRFLYSDFSGVAHGTDMSRYLSGLNGRPAFDGVRRPNELQQAAMLGAVLLVKAIRQMIERFRRGEDIGHWYVREVQPLYHQLGDLQIVFNETPAL